MMVSFVLSFFPRDVLDEILNLIESVSEDFPSYSLKSLGISALDHLASGIKSNPTGRKTHSKTNRRTVHNKFHKGRGRKNSVKKAISRKYSNLKFDPDIFD